MFSSSWRRLAFAATGSVFGLGVGEVLYVRHKFRLPPAPSGPVSGIERAPADKGMASGSVGDGSARLTKSAESRQRHVIFLGDSTVTGTGCSEVAGKQGPVMPRACASLLAERLGEDVGWTAICTVGAE